MNQIIRPRDESTGHARKSMREVADRAYGLRGYWSRWLEPYDGKLSSTVLRGEGGRETPDYPASLTQCAMRRCVLKPRFRGW